MAGNVLDAKDRATMQNLSCHGTYIPAGMTDSKEMQHETTRHQNIITKPTY